MIKRNANKGYKNGWVDFNQDGMSDKRRIKGKDKKYMQGLTRKRLEKELRGECNDGVLR